MPGPWPDGPGACPRGAGKSLWASPAGILWRVFPTRRDYIGLRCQPSHPRLACRQAGDGLSAPHPLPPPMPVGNPPLHGGCMGGGRGWACTKSTPQQARRGWASQSCGITAPKSWSTPQRRDFHGPSGHGPLRGAKSFIAPPPGSGRSFRTGRGRSSAPGGLGPGRSCSPRTGWTPRSARGAVWPGG